MVVTPGFVNGHMHISYAHAVRGIFPDDLGPAYLPNVFKLQGAMTEEEEYHTSLLAITELLKYGTTCFLDPGSTKYLDACMQAYQDSGCRIIVGCHVADQPNPINVPVHETPQATAAMEQTIQAYDHRLQDRVRAWAMPFSPGFSTPELLVAAKKLADECQTGLTLHYNNSSQYVEACLRQHGKRPTQYLEDIGILGPNVLLAHALGLDETEVECLARTGTKVVMCPTAAIKGGAGMTRTGLLPEMLQKRVTVGLGTDAGNNSNLLETMRSMYLAAVLYKDGRQDVTMVPAETALELATIQGARALGLGDQIGSIEVGKKADLVLFDTRRPEWRSIFNPVNNLVYNADGRSVHTVIVDGRIVVEGQKPLFADEWQLIQKVQELGEDLLARAGVSYPTKWPVV
jgi:cytosine/adenosine deaminase-related metal-dependent hydrolase